ncbi:ATP-binding protein [Actinoplanes sp. CA-030573]|uniref:PAS domain-containing sensor histidine kinase n=1 Tax=Actinoplanes sp. CA-030573 TaxID=3239898 RepID=UPI003D8A32C0
MSGAVDYEALFRSAPTAFLVLDPELTIVDANEAYLNATARSRAELIGRPVFAAFPDNPDDPAASGTAKLGASLGRVRRELVVDVMEIQKYDIPMAGGTFDVRYWAPVNAPVLDRDGRLRWIVHRAEDVTAFVSAHDGNAEAAQLAGALRVRTEQMAAEIFARRRLQRRHEALEAVIDSLEPAVIGTDAAGRPVLYNDAARELMGDTLGEVTAAEWGRQLHLYGADGRPIGPDLPLLRALRGERVDDVEIVLRPPGRLRRFFRVHSRPVTGQPGVAAVVAIHEITAARRAARLQECELAIAKATARPEADGQVLDEATRLIGSILGWDLVEFWCWDEAAGLIHRAGRWAGPALDLPPGLPEFLAPGQGLAGRAWADKQPVYQPGREDGPLRTALAVPVPLGPHPLGVLVCYADVAEIPGDVRAGMVTGVTPPLGVFLARRRAERLAAELDRARDQYIALVGHELRTPLTSIQAYTEMLLEEAGLTGDQRQMLLVVQRNTASLRAVVLKLLDVAALRAGHLDVRRRPMDLALVLREAADAARAGDRTHPIRIEAPGSAPIVGDPDRLRQVADELIANALTWSAAGSPVDIRLTPGEHTAVVSVSNTGVPIRADERPRLFEPFFRGDGARHSGMPGAGLGLSLAWTIVEQHGGVIEVSEAGSPATTFTVRIPTNRLPSRHPGETGRPGEPGRSDESGRRGEARPAGTRPTTMGRQTPDR